MELGSIDWSVVPGWVAVLLALVAGAEASRRRRVKRRRRDRRRGERRQLRERRQAPQDVAGEPSELPRTPHHY